MDVPRVKPFYFLALLLLALNYVSGMSASVDTSGGNQEELEKFVQAYFDLDEKSGRSNNEGFEDMLKRFREGTDMEGQQALPKLSSVGGAKDTNSNDRASAKDKQRHETDKGSGQVMDDSTKVSVNKEETKPKLSPNSPLGDHPQSARTPPRPTLPPPTKQSNRIDQFLVITDSSKDIRPQQTSTTPPPPFHEVVRADDMRNFFFNSGRGSSIMIPGCNLVHFHIKSRCSGNLLELALLSRTPVRGKVMLLEGDGQVDMEGTSLIVYAVLGPLTPTGNLWKLTKEVMKKDINRDCSICDNMNVRVVLKVEEATCGMVVSCQQKGSSKIFNVEDRMEKMKENSMPPAVTTPATTKSPSLKPASDSSQGTGDPPIQDPGNTAKTTMSLVYSASNKNLIEMAGLPVTDKVAMGTKMNLILSVFSRDITLDLHVVKCQAKGDDARGLPLVKDGCSVSHGISEFQETLSIVQESSFGTHTVRRVSQIAEISAFNFRRTSQNMTLICTIKMCGGECTERPPCVRSDINQGRSTRPPVPIFTQEVTLGKVFHVGGLPLDPSPDIANLILETEPKKSDPHQEKECPENCFSFKKVVIAIGFITAFYFFILLITIFYVRRSANKAVKGYHMDDFESPPRSLFSEYSSPRRRTPKSSPEQTTYSIEDHGGSPIYQKNV